MVTFSIRLKNPPEGAIIWWPIIGVGQVSYLSEEGINLSLDETAHFILPFDTEPTAIYHLLGILCKDQQNLIPPPNALDIWRVAGWWPEEGKSYVFDWSSGRVSEGNGMQFENFLPMLPWDGPPLPRLLGIYWPWYKKA